MLYTRRAIRCALLAAAAALALTPALNAQDLYDPTTFRSFAIQFYATNWLTLLPQNYASQTNIPADLTVDGVTYTGVGVRIRGNTSYTALPAGSQKWSLNVDMEFTIPGQTLMGYSTLNLNNSFRDPTFCREVMYSNTIARYMPGGRANHVNVTLNGSNWGVYANVQQFDKDLLREHFVAEDGLRIKCANNPNGPGLAYNGSSPSGYTGYEIKDTGGLADPWAAHIAVCNAVTNGSTTNWPAIDAIVAIDPSSWSCVWENLLTDDDSYSNKGCDFVTYRDPIDGRTHVLQTDANETFTQTSWAPTRNFTSTTKPLLSHVFGIPELRQRYLAHYRTAKQELSWAVMEPVFTAMRNRIEAAVQADPKKIYSYTLFTQNFTQTVTLPGGGPGGGTVVGLSQFVNNRLAYLNTQAELVANGPTITEVQPSDSFPDPSQQVWITAAVAPNPSAISRVDLFYRTSLASQYQRLQMFDNGASGDGPAGNGVYGALLPFSGNAGQLLRYYVMATAANSYNSVTFSPALAENGPADFSYSFGMSGLRVTEWMYSGVSGEFLELTNTSTAPIDLAGWSINDESAAPGGFSISSVGVLQPGKSVVVTDAAPATFASAWSINTATTPVLGPNLTAELGRNDSIYVFNSSGGLVERLRYGDEDYPGTIRTLGTSGHTCRESVGQDNVGEWFFAQAGDAYQSRLCLTGEVGSPGVWANVSCFAPACPADLDGDSVISGGDLAVLLSAWGGSGAADLDGSGTVDGSDLASMLGAWGACP